MTSYPSFLSSEMRVDLRELAASCAHTHVAQTFMGLKFAFFSNHKNHENITLTSLKLPGVRSALQSLFGILHNYDKRWCFEANVKRCAVVIFAKVGKVSCGWVWGGESLPT